MAAEADQSTDAGERQLFHVLGLAQGVFVASGYLFALSWITIGVAFVVRRWEDQSLKP
jgi:hypothetical protein